jgi:hypothetical protein
MGHVSEYIGTGRKSDGEAGNGTSRPMQRDNHNLIQR